MNKKTTGRISAMAMASMMMMSVFAVSAGAEENTATPITQIDLTKTVTTDGNTYQPNTSFTFHVSNGAAITNWRDNVVYAGVTGGITATKTITYQPSGSDTLSDSYSQTTKLDIDTSVFPYAGVYHYVVQEAAGSYSGIDYDTTARDVYLFVYNNEDGSLYVGNVIVEKGGDKEEALSFVNDYGQTYDTTHDVTISKSITGDQKNTSKEFKFNVAVDGGEGELYKVVVKKNAGAQAVTEYLTSGAAAKSYWLSDTGTISIYGLTADDEYTVTEVDANTDGYKTSIGGTRSQTGTTSGKVEEDGTLVQYDNHKDAISVTGVTKKYTPYALLVGAAGALGAVFFRRKRA